MSNDVDKIKQAIWNRIEEMKQGDYADPEGKHAHFFEHSDEEINEQIDKTLSIDGMLTRPTEEILDSVIESLFIG